MKVWAVIEMCDYSTVEVFATEELADEYARRFNEKFKLKGWPRDDFYVVEELDVLTALPVAQ